jgi:hypothetical protein
MTASDKFCERGGGEAEVGSATNRSGKFKQRLFDLSFRDGDVAPPERQGRQDLAGPHGLRTDAPSAIVGRTRPGQSSDPAGKLREAARTFRLRREQAGQLSDLAAAGSSLKPMSQPKMLLPAPGYDDIVQSAELETLKSS